MGSAEYDGSSPENVVVAMETVEHNERHKLLSNEKFETSYVVELRARTSKGWGASLRTTTRTIKRSGEKFNHVTRAFAPLDKRSKNDTDSRSCLPATSRTLLSTRLLSSNI